MFITLSQSTSRSLFVMLAFAVGGVACGDSESTGWRDTDAARPDAALGSDGGVDAQVEEGPRFLYRTTVTVTNPGESVDDHQIRIELDARFAFEHVRSDGSDVRITLAGSLETLPFWIERWEPPNAVVWVRVPRFVSGANELTIFYGNGTASTKSSGPHTFLFFDDFDGDIASTGYFALGDPAIAMTQAGWEPSAPHTLSVVELNRGGYRFWGYYGLVGCDGFGLARSNDLVTWVREPAPLFASNQERWPTALRLADGSIVLAHTIEYCSPQSSIVLRTSEDGESFSEPRTLVAPEANIRNQNPALFRDPKTGMFHLYWFRGVPDFWEIREKHAANIDDLPEATSQLLLRWNTTLAAPHVWHLDGTYYLLVETYEDDQWRTRAFTSTSPGGPFRELPGNPIFGRGAACAFQFVFDDTLHIFYCQQDLDRSWRLDHRSAPLSAGHATVLGPSPDRFEVREGAFNLVDTESARGRVLRGETLVATHPYGRPYNQVARLVGPSDDVILETDVRLVGGRVFGIGIDARNGGDLYSVNLYEDLDGAANLFAYRWRERVAEVLQSTTVGALARDEWHAVRVAVGSGQMQVAFDGTPRLDVSGTPVTDGLFAWFGERETVADLDRVRMRRIGPEAVQPPDIGVETMQRAGATEPSE